VSETADDQPTFESALEALEEVVRRLEGGDVGLEEAVTLFENGQRQLAICRERLASVETRIEELTAADLPRQADETFDDPLARPSDGG
jgi:exodeoxyribonuclease VII small subunit